MSNERRERKDFLRAIRALNCSATLAQACEILANYGWQTSPRSLRELFAKGATRFPDLNLQNPGAYLNQQTGQAPVSQAQEDPPSSDDGLDPPGLSASAPPEGKLPSRLRDYASALQKEAIDAVNRHCGDHVAAAKDLGIEVSALDARIVEAWRKAARAGYSPKHDYTHPQPDGFHTKGVSTLYRADGTVAQQWVKSAKDTEDRIDMLREAFQTIAEPFRGASEPTKAPKSCDEDLLTIYPIGDEHLGMLSWSIETGADFDLEIAERNLVAAVDKLVDLAPPSEVDWLVDLGDFFHTDNGSNRTNASGHTLDVDSRYVKMCTVGVRGVRRCVDRMLEKHKRVRCTFEIGNHNEYSALWLGLAIGAFYENNPRVEVDPSPAFAHWYRFGKCLIGVTHGHTVKPQALAEVMATDRAKDWGETSFRYWYTGHVHHDSLKEFRGCTVETFRTLAARDAWHTQQGYRSGRDMKCDVLHKDRGKILRHTVGVEALEGAA